MQGEGTSGSVGCFEEDEAVIDAVGLWGGSVILCLGWAAKKVSGGAAMLLQRHATWHWGGDHCIDPLNRCSIRVILGLIGPPHGIQRFTLVLFPPYFVSTPT